MFSSSICKVFGLICWPLVYIEATFVQGERYEMWFDSSTYGYPVSAFPSTIC